MFIVVHLISAGSDLEKAIADGPEALKKYIASGAIEELHDVMPHDEDNDYLNDAYLDDDSTPTPSAAVDVQLPPPLPSSKLAQQVAQKSQMNMSNQLQNLQNQGLGMSLDKSNANDKQRRSRFSDLSDDPHGMDSDMRMYSSFAGSQQQRNTNTDVDLRTMPGIKQPNLDVDMRNHDDMDDDQDDDDQDYRSSYMDQNYRRYEDNDGPSYNQGRSQQQQQQQWPQNNGTNQQYSQQGSDNFRSSFMQNQNGPFGPFTHGNFRGDYRGPPPFGDNFRSQGPGPWNGMQRSDSFRSRGFGPRMGMRGGPRPPRGFPGGPGGPRGGWMPPRGSGPNSSMRGRNVF